MDKDKKSSNLLSMEKLAVIDLGTNTAIFSVVEIHEDRLIITYENSITTRIGQNLSATKAISEEVLERNMDIISTELKIIRKKFGNIRTIGLATEAIRRAGNGKECLEKINTTADVKLEIISGQEEALYTLEAVRRLYDIDHGAAAICDIGGGSTEINIVFDGKTIKTESIPLGVVRLEEKFNITNNFDNATKAFERIKELLGPVFERVDKLVLCGGTGTSVAALMLGLEIYDPTQVEGFKFTSKTLDALLSNLLVLDLEELRKVLITDTGRADVITAGTLIMKTMNDLFTPKEFIITTIGPRHGFIIKKLGLNNIKEISYAINQ